MMLSIPSRQINSLMETLAMSEHRRRNDDGLCKTWPDCTCAQHWRQYQDVDWSKMDFAATQPVVKAMLSCISHRCPDAQFRLKAFSQLTHPVFDDDAVRLN